MLLDNHGNWQCKINGQESRNNKFMHNNKRIVSRFTITRTSLMAIILIPVAYILSFSLLSYYTEGDQVWYTNLYEALRGAQIHDAVLLTFSHTGGVEPLAAVILWSGANLGIEKNIYISLLNVILITCLFFAARQHSVRPPMIALLLTNYYLLGLITAAERLKIAYIILAFALVSAGKLRIVFLACSPFAHLQSLIFLICIATAKQEHLIKDLILKFRVARQSIIMLIGLATAIPILIYLTFEGVESKLNAYSELGSVGELVNLIILMPIAIYVSKRRLRMSLTLLPLIPVILAIGAIRVNMIAVTLVIYLLMEERRLNHPLIYLLMIYFSVKSIGYIDRVLSTGQGF